VPEKTVRSATIRKEGRDAGLTPTEKRRKDILMRQFVKGDGAKGNSPEYKANYDLIDWGTK
jgi:hypothetical protein